MELDKQLTLESTKENSTTSCQKNKYDKACRNCGHELALYCIHSESKLEEILNITKKEE